MSERATLILIPRADGRYEMDDVTRIGSLIEELPDLVLWWVIDLELAALMLSWELVGEEVEWYGRRMHFRRDLSTQR